MTVPVGQTVLLGAFNSHDYDTDELYGGNCWIFGTHFWRLVFRCDVKILAEWDVVDVKSVYDVYKMMSVVAYMAQLVKALVAKSEDLSLIPEIYIVEGQNQVRQDVLWFVHTQYDICVCV